MSTYRYSNILVIPSVEKAETRIRDIALAAKVEISMTKFIVGSNDQIKFEVTSNDKKKIDCFIEILMKAVDNYKKLSNPGLIK